MLPSWRKYLLEVGMGIDLHGENVTKAAQRAVKDAISHVSMIGLREILAIEGKEDLDQSILVDVTVATPYPQRVNKEAVLSILPEGIKKLKVVEGGMRFPTPKNQDLPHIPGVVLANAVIVVMFNTEKSKLRL